MSESHEVAARKLLIDTYLDASSDRHELRRRHDAAMSGLKEDPQMLDIGTDGLVEQISLTSAYVTAIVCLLHEDGLLRLQPAFSLTDRARSALMLRGGSDSQMFLSYGEMAEIATMTSMYDPSRRAKLSAKHLKDVQLVIETAMRDAEVNAGYLESAGYFIRD